MGYDGLDPEAVTASEFNPELFKGHVGDVSTIIRLAVTSRKNTPDLCSIMNLLGKARVEDRINNALKSL